MVEIQNQDNGLKYRFSIPAKFEIGFDESKNPEQDSIYPEKPQKGWQTSYAVCDTLVSLPAGSYKTVSYELYNSDKKRSGVYSIGKPCVFPKQKKWGAAAPQL